MKMGDHNDGMFNGLSLGKPRSPRSKKFGGMLPSWKEGDEDLPLPKFLNQRLEELEKSQQQLADLCMRTQPWVSQLCSGKVWNISAVDVVILSKALEIVPQQLWDVIYQTVTEKLTQSGMHQVPEEGAGVLVVTKAGFTLKSIVEEGSNNSPEEDLIPVEEIPTANDSHDEL
jgi:hypothetical protein